MEPSLNCSNHHPNLILACNDHHHHEDSISASWRHSQRPATYLEDQVGAIGRRLEPLQPLCPCRGATTTSPTSATYSPCEERAIHHAEHAPSIPFVASSDYITLSPSGPTARRMDNASAIASMEKETPLKVCTTILPDCAGCEGEGSVQPSSARSARTEGSAITLVSSTIAKLYPWRPRPSITQESSPASTASSSGIRSVDNNGEVGTACVDDSSSGASNDTLALQPSKGKCKRIDSTSVATHKQKPVIPRIVVPDGASINLSTPSSTPRRERRAATPNQTLIWSYRLTGIMDRLLARGHRTDTEDNSFAQKPSSRRPQHDVEGYAGDGIEMLMHSSTGSRDHNSQLKDTTERTQRTSMEAQARNSFARDPPDTTKTPAYSGYPGTAESIASSEKDVWWEDEGVPGGVFSRTRWRFVFCSRPGFVVMFNHVSATLLGLLIIIAIGLTALGKIRERGQVSDDLPTSLAGRIMEAQIAVVKDFEQLDNRPSLRRRLISRAHDASTSSHLAMLNRASKVPVWVAPLVQPDCFDQKCDFKHFGKEYFAFMNPESFGIALPQDWPSLCNSCIEISRNEFVHKTTVRILGDLASCAANAPLLSPSSSFSSSTQDTAAAPTRALDTTLSVTPTTTHSPSITTVIHMTYTTLSTTSATTLLRVKTSTLMAPQRPQRITGLPTPLVRIRATTHQPAATASFQRDGKSFKGQPHPSRSVSIQKNLRQQQRQQHVQRRDDHTINRRDDSIQEDSASTAQLPYLIVDPAAFSNLTRYETQQSLQELTSLHVHFRFVLCDG